MANIQETSNFDTGIYQLETTDYATGGLGGVMNRQAAALANRTKYLKDLSNNSGFPTTTTQLDINVLFASGLYYVSGSAVGSPVSGVAGFLTVSALNNQSAFQMFNAMSSDRIFTRRSSSGGNWLPWRELQTSAQLTGAIVPFGRSTPPEGWLMCDGSAVSRTAYAFLFAEIGTTFGSGNFSTTFNLPDLRGEFVRGWDNGRGVDPLRSLGSFQGSQNLSHNHILTVVDGADSLGGAGFLTSSGSTSGSGSYSPSASISTSGGGEARPRSIALNYCIKYT